MSGPGPPPHILILNDVPEFLGLLQRLFEREGYQVSIALNLIDLAEIRAITPDVIIQDLLFDGSYEASMQLLRQVRHDPELGSIPVIVCTAAVPLVTEQLMATEMVYLGVTMLFKPFTLHELLTVTTEALSADPPAPLP